jgi:hypothetical protein
MAAGSVASVNIQCIVVVAESQHPKGVLTKAGRGTRTCLSVGGPLLGAWPRNHMHLAYASARAHDRHINDLI